LVERIEIIISKKNKTTLLRVVFLCGFSIDNKKKNNKKDCQRN